jgi:hypothetical protein
MLAALVAGGRQTSDASGRVVLERVGIQPQVAADARGTLHVVFVKGDPAAGDIYYVRRAPEGG